MLGCEDTLFLITAITTGKASSKGRVVSQENSGTEGDGEIAGKFETVIGQIKA